MIGCGKIGSEFSEQRGAGGGQTHAAAYRENARTTLVGLCDATESRSAAAGKFWGVPSFTDFRAACDQLKPDIVSICTPDSSHATLAGEVIERFSPRLLLVEKPLALSSAAAADLIRSAKAKGVTLAVNYSRRYLPLVQRIAAEIGSGGHGKPLLMRALYGKGLFHNGSHALDLARLWLGEPQRVTRTGPDTWGPEGDPTVSALLEFASGARFFLQGFNEKVATVFEVDLLTERSRWSFRLGGAQWDFSTVQASPHHAGYSNYLPAAPVPLPEITGALPRAVGNIVAFLDGEEQLLCPADDALRTIELAEKIRKA